ncbi:MAG: hypothetical protein ISS34_01795 [Candidatus Omnitrophica bacterium]|nr:hypothetical protein [Candidatus Omnitrophota bacterium]
MKDGFGSIISGSIEWTKVLLFKPFSFKKWLALFIIALFAFELQGGCNFNFDLPAKKDAQEAKRVPQKPDDAFSFDKAGGVYDNAAQRYGRTKVALLTVFIGVLIVLLLLLLEWIYSNFSFLFIEAVAKNEASIRGPFVRNRPLGNSYFAWNIAYLIMVFGVYALLAKGGYDSLARLGVFKEGIEFSFGMAVKAILVYLTAGICFSIFSLLLSFFISNYVLIVMYKDRLSILNALPVSLGLVTSDIASFVKYIFVKLGLRIVTSIMGSVIALCLLITLFIPGILLAAIFVIIYKIIPVPAQPAYIIIMSIAGVPLIAALLVFMNMVFLPLSVFHRTFNLKFISRISDKYNLFKLT